MIPLSMAWLSAIGFAFAQAPAAPSQSPSADATILHSPASIAVLARELEKAHPQQVKVLELGTSRGGGEFIGLRITATQNVPKAQPAILLVAGLDGARAYTGTMAMDHARELATGYNQRKDITALLDSTTLYIIPFLDVDACAGRFQTPLAEILGTGLGVDNDRDGQQGEDGPGDINGDGFITVMRQAHPEGQWIEDPNDARVLMKADPAKGERGRWKRITEGLDSDGDEEVAEDPALDAIINRNFPRNWTEHSPTAGRYPTHEPSPLALVKFMLEHRDIALVMTYGEEANLGEKPKAQAEGSGSRGKITTGIHKDDLPTYEELGKRYRELTSNKTKALGEQPGSFQAFAYHHSGLLCLDIDPWSVPLDAKQPKDEKEEEGEEESADESAETEGETADKKDEPKPSDDAKRLLWLDQNAPEAFLPWTAFEHPQLGPVEIGGFKPYCKVEPPADLLPAITSQHFQFLLSLGAYLPRLRIVELESRPLGAGLLEITCVLENAALLPQQTRAALRSRTIRPARVRIALPAKAELLSGQRQTLVSDLRPSGGRKEFRWLIGGVQNGEPIRIELDTDNAGQATITVEVN